MPTPATSSLLDTIARVFPRIDDILFPIFAGACVLYAGGAWSAPLDDVFIHFGCARVTQKRRQVFAGSTDQFTRCSSPFRVRGILLLIPDSDSRLERKNRVGRAKSVIGMEEAMTHLTTSDNTTASSSGGAGRKCFARGLGRFVSCAALLCSGCTIYLGPYDDKGATASENPSVLPDPNEGPIDEPALDEAQQARKEEADRYVMDVIYQGGTIVETIKLPSGDVIDFIDRGTLPPLPYELPPVPFTAEDLALPPGVELGLSEFEQIPEALALAATATPFQRPTFWAYIVGETDAISIEDYLNRYQIAGQLLGSDHVYAGLISKKPNRGISGRMNQFRPEVEPGTFSLLEFAIGCPLEKPLEMVGVAISVDKVNFFGNSKPLTDDEPRLHVEYSAIDKTTGQSLHAWDGVDGSFKPNPFRTKYHPGQKVTVSVLAGKQVEHFIAIFQEPVTRDWWILYNDELLGYYPASLFTNLNDGACVSQWYGEVARWKPASPSPWPKTEMGSGKFAADGPLLAAYVRNPTYYDLSWGAVEPQDTFIGAPNKVNETCYDRSDKVDSLFFLGGPGGKNPGCIVQ